MSERPIDASTGRPADKRDHEVRDELREKHVDTWRDRDGEPVRVVVLHDGLTAFGKVWQRGEIIETTVGSDAWVESCDPISGESFLDLDIGQQIARWKRRMLASVDEIGLGDLPPDPTADDRPNRADVLARLADADTDSREAKLEAARLRYEARQRARERAGIDQAWRDQDEVASLPYRTASVHREFPTSP